MNQKEVEKEQYEMQERFNEEMSIIKKFKFVAVGYLNITEEYFKGPVSQNFINKLKIVWNSNIKLGSCGHHVCELCEGEEKATSSSEQILVDKENNIKYIFPEMIFHYIEKHDYQPPKEFVEFILKK